MSYSYTEEAKMFEHEANDPDHVIDYIDDCGLVYYKCGCIRDRG